MSIAKALALYDELTATENLVLFGKLYGLADAEKGCSTAPEKSAEHVPSEPVRSEQVLPTGK